MNDRVNNKYKFHLNRQNELTEIREVIQQYFLFCGPWSAEMHRRFGRIEHALDEMIQMQENALEEEADRLWKSA